VFEFLAGQYAVVCTRHLHWFWSPPILLTGENRGTSPEGTRPSPAAGHLPSWSNDFKNEWCHTFTHSRLFAASTRTNLVLDFIMQAAATFVNHVHTINLHNTLGSYVFNLQLFLQLRPSNQHTITGVIFYHKNSDAHALGFA
jgi:hypothetical protein